MISSFMRYCVFNKDTVSGLLQTIFCIKVSSNPPRMASMHLIVGGSWQWSPANMTLSALRMAIQQAASSAWAASSINKVPNFMPINMRFAELTKVHAITLASLNRASLMRISNSVARSFKEFIFCRKLSRLAPFRFCE